MSTFCLLLCYTVSTATYYRIRPSLFVSHHCQEIKIRKYLTNSFPGDSAEPAVLRSLPRRLDAADDWSVHGAILPLPHRHRVLRLPRPHRGLRHGIRGRDRPLYWRHPGLCVLEAAAQPPVLTSGKSRSRTSINLWSQTVNLIVPMTISAFYTFLK